MAESRGGSGQALSDKGKHSKSETPNKSGGQPESGLNLTLSAKAGTAKSQADLDRKGSKKA